MIYLDLQFHKHYVESQCLDFCPNTQKKNTIMHKERNRKLDKMGSGVRDESTASLSSKACLTHFVHNKRLLGSRPRIESNVAYVLT